MSPASERSRRVDQRIHLPSANDLFAALVHASVLDGLVGAAKVLTVTVLLGAEVTAAVPVLGLVAFSIYGSNKLVDDEDAVNAPERAAFVAAHREALLAATVIGYVLALALALARDPVAFALVAFPGVAAVAYSVELPIAGGRRLKDVLGLNNLLVSVAWALPVVGIPLVWADHAVTATAGVAFAFYLVQTTVAFEVRNVRDVAGDRAEGVRTVPVVFGVPATRYLLYGVDASALALYAAATAAGVLALPVGVVFAAATASSVAITALVDRDIDDVGLEGLDDGRLCLLRDANYGLVLAVVALAG